MTSRKGLIRSVLMIVALVAAAVPVLAFVRATEGVVTRIDSTAKTIAVKTADGTEEVFKFSGKTALRAADGVKTGAVGTYFAGKEGTHVVVRYTGEGAEKTAVGIDDFGKDSFRVSKGVVTGVDKGAHTVTVRTEDGSEETYHLTKDAAVDTEHGVVRAPSTPPPRARKSRCITPTTPGKKLCTSLSPSDAFFPFALARLFSARSFR